MNCVVKWLVVLIAFDESRRRRATTGESVRRSNAYLTEIQPMDVVES